MAKKTLEKRDGDDNQPFLFADLPEVRPDGSENLDQNGKKRRKRGPPGTTPDERAAMHKNKGVRGKTPLGAGLDRVDIGG